MGYYTTVPLLHLCLYLYACEFYIYGYLNMCVYFILSAPWLRDILGIL